VDFLHQFVAAVVPKKDNVELEAAAGCPVLCKVQRG
jgi:hypothetical protein